MSGRPTERFVVLIAVCLIATGGVAAGVYGTSGPADADTGATVADDLDGERAASGDARRQTGDGPVVIEPGETVTGNVTDGKTYAFDIERDERATIEVAFDGPDGPSEGDSMDVRAELPDGSYAPDRIGLRVGSGETRRFNATTTEPGRATIFYEPADLIRDRGTYEISLEIASRAVPDEPNDDRGNATLVELNASDAAPNATVSAELDGADVDYYAFEIPEYQSSEYSSPLEVPVSVTVDRGSEAGVSVLNVNTAPVGLEADTVTRYVGDGTPTTVRFSGEEAERYYVAVANVEGGGGPYELRVAVNESTVTAEPVPENDSRTFDEISQAAYDLPFDELSDPTSLIVREIYFRQFTETKLTRNEISRRRYGMPFSELSEETKGEITILYRAQFAGGPP